MADGAEPLPVLDALHSTPARRYLSSEAIPDEIIWALLDAAVRGPTGGNQQGWPDVDLGGKLELPAVGELGHLDLGAADYSEALGHAVAAMTGPRVGPRHCSAQLSFCGSVR